MKTSELLELHQKYWSGEGVNTKDMALYREQVVLLITQRDSEPKAEWLPVPEDLEPGDYIGRSRDGYAAEMELSANLMWWLSESDEHVKPHQLLAVNGQIVRVG
jgi:hypothetical protein